MARPITQLQYDRFLAIKGLIKSKSPVMVTLADIVESLKMESTSAAHKLVETLIRDGYLKRAGKKKALTPCE